MSTIYIEDLSILLVEPSVTQGKIIANELRKSGVHQIDVTHSISEAIQKLESYHPDLVISAMYFDEGTGTDLVLKLRHDKRFESVPFMLVSSEQRIEYLDPIKQAGVVAILPKPFDGADLRAALISTLDYLEESDLDLDNFDIRSLRILLVDDSALARKHIQRILNNLGAEDITHAVDGSEAIALLQQREFDLVVTDYNMPKVDGGQLLHYIRKESQQSYIPVLMVTSERNQTTLNTIQKSGVSALCDKPFDTQHVKHLLKNLL